MTTLKVDITELNALLSLVKEVHLVLDSQSDIIQSLSAQLDAAITGTLPSIASFEAKFSGWTSSLNTLTTDMDQAYNLLTQISGDAQNVDAILKTSI